MPKDGGTDLPLHDPQDFRDELRSAQERTRANREKRVRIAEAGGMLRNCADYATPGAIHLLPGESRALEEERAMVAETLDANEEFCNAWVRKRWIPSIDAALLVVDANVVERFEPHVTENEFGAEILRVALRATHRLYCALIRDRDAADGVIRDLAALRAQLGPNRYVIQQTFSQMAAHVERAARLPGEEGPPSLERESKAPPSARVPGDLPAGEPVRLSAPELAQKYDVPVEALRKALERYRLANPGRGFIEVSDRGRKEPKYLYDLTAVLQVIEGVKERAENDDRTGPT